MTRKVEKKNGRATRRGLVLSGGGALGAFQAGALKAIRENGIEFQVIAATSIGLLHALAWNREDMVLSLDDRWREDAARMNPFDLRRVLRLKNPFTFRASLDELFDRYRTTQPSPDAYGQTPIIVSLTEAATGRNVAFSLAAPDLLLSDKENICKASTIIPLLGDDPIEIQGKRYYDGGFSNNLPVDYLEELDLDEIWAIAVTPPRTKKPWHGPLWRRAIEKREMSENPWMLGAASLAAQFFSPVYTIASKKKLVMIRPDPGGSYRLSRLYRALTFSPKEIDALLALGYRRGRQVCQDYLSRSSPASVRVP